jgi:hypothetical protein
MKMGGYINTKGNLIEFKVLQCEACHEIGSKDGSRNKIPYDKGVHMMFETKPITIYYKETEDGRQYEPLCGPCSTKISLIKVEKAEAKD